MGYWADLWTKIKDWWSGEVPLIISVTQAEWDNRSSIESEITSRAYALIDVNWESYSCFIDEDLMVIFFVKNDLIPVNEADVVAKWENDDSMVVGVGISLM